VPFGMAVEHFAPREYQAPPLASSA
jgi:hypothetical protein